MEWIKRYSSTDEPDFMGRWARMGILNGITICWISIIKDKYCTHMYIPTRLSDSPHEIKVFDTYEDAQKFAYNKLREFEIKINGSDY